MWKNRIPMNRFLSLISVLVFLALPARASVPYPYRFAPAEGFVNRFEKPLRDEICLNGYWDFQAVPAVREGSLPLPGGSWEETRIKIPSPWNVNSFARYRLEGPDHRDFPSYPDSWEKADAAWMRKAVRIPESWDGNRILLHFEAVAGCSEVYVNDRKVAENFDLFLPFEADVTDFVKPGEVAEILVGVRSQRVFEDPSSVGRRIVPAGSMWGTHIVGIWQDVYLLKRPAVSIDDVFIRPSVSEGTVRFTVTVTNRTGRPQSLTLSGRVNAWLNRASTDIAGAPVPDWELGEEAVVLKPVNLTVPAGESVQAELTASGSTLRCWSPEHPDLYALRLSLEQGKKSLDLKYERFGYREWTFQGTRLCLNGAPYELRSDSWHFMGIPQMTRRYAWAWYTAIKGMNGNAVRPHAQVYPRFYLDLADEMGICVLDETANWASDGGPKLDDSRFWEASKDHLRRLVRRDRNHPSIFGWSVSNENKPVILHVHKRPDLMPLQEQAWKDWVGIVREEDPTRPWISSDGEEDGEGILPATVGHYGDEGSMRAWKAIGKPWGVGEHSMAYYGTPLEVARYNGERAYESALGRMEGLAYECYHLLRNMREAGASYSTVFNMAWYALKPLPLGKKDLTKPVSMEDGITFGPYVEGQPGVQPERLGPYSTTFNPGYDPSLPLFDTWPLYDAMRAANAPEGAAYSPWADISESPKPTATTAAEPYRTVLYVGPDDSRLKRILETQGVLLSPVPTGKRALRDAGRILVIVDASAPRNLPALEADYWFWGVNPESAGMVDGLTVTPLRRSSFLPKDRSWVRGMKNSDFYFCEDQRADAARFSLSGRFVQEGEVLLEACRTDWRRWNKQAEDMKTASLLRSEYESTEPLPIFVKNGNIWVSTLDDFLGSERGYRALHTILENAGVPLGPVSAQSFEAFDDGIYQPGILTRPVDGPA